MPANVLAAELIAPEHWQSIDFISDLHLQADAAANISGMLRWTRETPAQAAFILGDLFEAWIGDDVLGEQGFESQICSALKTLAKRCSLFFIHGNRDFLIKQRMLSDSGMQALADPCTLSFSGQRILIGHGDIWCTDDTDYQAFRRMVRSPEWQDKFLNQDLQARRSAAQAMRLESQRRQSQQKQWIDVDPQALQAALNAAQCQHIIHGHTHEGAAHLVHSAQGEGMRYALSDWELLPQFPRGYSLRLHKKIGHFEAEICPASP